MDKATVTKKEMEAIQRQKNDRDMNLQDLLHFAYVKNFCGKSEPINHMSVEQIFLGWHGHAEVEPEYVSFDEAMKAGKEGKDITFHWEKSKYKITSQNLIQWGLRNLSVSDHGLLDLVNGKWTIEEGK